MKTVLFKAVIFSSLFLGFFCGCSPTDTENKSGDEPFLVSKSAVPRVSTVPENGELEAQATSINQFSVAMYKQLAEDDANIFFSPYSITSALGMAEAGAKGATASQIREALSVTLDGDAFHSAMNALDQDMIGHTESVEGVTLNVVNSTWAQIGWDFKLSYLDFLGKYYGAGVNLLDFANEPEPSRITINEWVEEQTNEKIKDLIPAGGINNDTRLVLTNAIYFLADWNYQFDAGLTTDEDFTKLDESKIKVPLMQLGEWDEKIKMEYANIDGDRSINLPYKGGRMCMTVLLPESGTFETFEQELTVAKVNDFVSAMDTVELPPVRLPKFTYTTGSMSLAEALQRLGMKDAFVGGVADFSKIDGRKDLVVADVIHKAFIAVDEKGTEAAAATAVTFELTSMPDDRTAVKFVADRPFIYLIRDTTTGAILFMGRVLDPTVKE